MLSRRLGEATGPDLPLQAPPFEKTLDMLDQGLRREGATPVLPDAVKSPARPDLRAELAEIIEEQYGVISRLGPSCRWSRLARAARGRSRPPSGEPQGRRRRDSRGSDLLSRSLVLGTGPAEGATTTIAVNLPARYLHTIFATVTPAGSIATPGGVWTEERGAPIYVCTHQMISRAAAWPAARHYG